MEKPFLLTLTLTNGYTLKANINLEKISQPTKKKPQTSKKPRNNRESKTANCLAGRSSTHMVRV